MPQKFANVKYNFSNGCYQLAAAAGVPDDLHGGVIHIHVKQLYIRVFLCYPLATDNALEGLPKRLEMNEMELDNTKKQFETAKVDVERPFPQEEELKAKTDRLNELNALLNVDKRENEIVGGEPDEGEEPPEKKPRDLER